jgi:DNA-binding MarR family transcriptional regulator
MHEGSELFGNMDYTSNQLLNVIARHHANRDPLTVTTAIALKSIASQTTLYRKLNELIKLGLIQKDYKFMDRKTKYLIPTEISDEYFSSLGNAIERALLDK